MGSVTPGNYPDRSAWSAMADHLCPWPGRSECPGSRPAAHRHPSNFRGHFTTEASQAGRFRSRRRLSVVSSDSGRRLKNSWFRSSRCSRPWGRPVPEAPTAADGRSPGRQTADRARHPADPAYALVARPRRFGGKCRVAEMALERTGVGVFGGKSGVVWMRSSAG